MTLFVKTLFSVNFLLLFAGVATVGFCQEMGNLFAGSITVAFPEEVWKEALTKTPDGFQRRFLIYSSFNGVYKKVEGMTHGGRPMYRELKKSSGTEEFTRHVPAEIKYCEKEGFWAFTHKDIQKSESETESTQCNWLLRSPETQAFDLMDVSRDWSVWVGVIKDGINVNLKVNGCKGDADCNLNGVCKDEKCVCDPNGTHYGLHCELDIPCHRIIREDDNTTWTARRSHTSDCKDSDDFVYQYMRPIYTSDNYGSSHVKSDRLNFVYAGSRWRAMRVHGIENKTSEEQVDFGSDFHSFWDLSCNFSAPTLLVSDPTSRSMPVGVDFYMTGSEEGDQYGPFGVLHPIQDPPGNYPFRCDHSFTKASAIAACRNQSST